MKKTIPPTNVAEPKKGYNEKNPGQPHGAFPPASDQQKGKEKAKSNAAGKKEKEDEA